MPGLNLRTENAEHGNWVHGESAATKVKMLRLVGEEARV